MHWEVWDHSSWRNLDSPKMYESTPEDAPHLGLSWVSICRTMLSIQERRSRTMLKKRNLSAVSTS